MAHLENALLEMMEEKGERVNVPGLIGKASMESQYTDTGKRIPTEMTEDREEQ
jgi:hypothetical protein